jgi:GrpB protein
MNPQRGAASIPPSLRGRRRDRGHFNQVQFRDHLRTHPEAVTRYEARKLELAHLITPNSRERYLDAKAGVVEQLLRRPAPTNDLRARFASYQRRVDPDGSLRARAPTIGAP